MDSNSVMDFEFLHNFELKGLVSDERSADLEETDWNLQLIHEWHSLEPTNVHLLATPSADHLKLYIFQTNGMLKILNFKDSEDINFQIEQEQNLTLSSDPLVDAIPLSFRSHQDLVVTDNHGKVFILSQDVVIERLDVERHVNCMTPYSDACMMFSQNGGLA
jgi:hypothetical protein